MPPKQDTNTAASRPTTRSITAALKQTQSKPQDQTQTQTHPTAKQTPSFAMPTQAARGKQQAVPSDDSHSISNFPLPGEYASNPAMTAAASPSTPTAADKTPLASSSRPPVVKAPIGKSTGQHKNTAISIVAPNGTTTEGGGRVDRALRSRQLLRFHAALTQRDKTIADDLADKYRDLLQAPKGQRCIEFARSCAGDAAGKEGEEPWPANWGKLKGSFGASFQSIERWAAEWKKQAHVDDDTVAVEATVAGQNNGGGENAVQPVEGAEGVQEARVSSPPPPIAHSKLPWIDEDDAAEHEQAAAEAPLLSKRGELVAADGKDVEGHTHGAVAANPQQSVPAPGRDLVHVPAHTALERGTGFAKMVILPDPRRWASQSAQLLRPAAPRDVAYSTPEGLEDTPSGDNGVTVVVPSKAEMEGLVKVMRGPLPFAPQHVQDAAMKEQGDKPTSGAAVAAVSATVAVASSVTNARYEGAPGQVSTNTGSRLVETPEVQPGTLSTPLPIREPVNSAARGGVSPFIETRQAPNISTATATSTAPGVSRATAASSPLRHVTVPPAQVPTPPATLPQVPEHQAPTGATQAQKQGPGEGHGAASGQNHGHGYGIDAREDIPWAFAPELEARRHRKRGHYFPGQQQSGAASVSAAQSQPGLAAPFTAETPTYSQGRTASPAASAQTSVWDTWTDEQKREWYYWMRFVRNGGRQGPLRRQQRSWGGS